MPRTTALCIFLPANLRATAPFELHHMKKLLGTSINPSEKYGKRRTCRHLSTSARRILFAVASAAQDKSEALITTCCLVGIPARDSVAIASRHSHTDRQARISPR